MRLAMLSGGVLTKDMQENLNKLVMQPLTAEERSLLGGTLPTDHAQEPDSIQFSVPLRGDLHSGADPVMKVVCGGQHIALLTASGALYTVGAGSACGLDAQSAVRAAEKFVERGMGGASRQETIAIVREAGAGHKVPTRVGVEVGGKRMRVLDVSCGLKHMVVAIADEEDIEVAKAEKDEEILTLKKEIKQMEEELERVMDFKLQRESLFEELEELRETNEKLIEDNKRDVHDLERKNLAERTQIKNTMYNRKTLLLISKKKQG